MISTELIIGLIIALGGTIGTLFKIIMDKDKAVVEYLTNDLEHSRKNVRMLTEALEGSSTILKRCIAVLEKLGNGRNDK